MKIILFIICYLVSVLHIFLIIFGIYQYHIGNVGDAYFHILINMSIFPLSIINTSKAYTYAFDD